MDNFGGFDWLIATTGVVPVQPLTVNSRFGNARSTVATADRRRVETYPKAMRPGPTVEGHLFFAFRYEPIHLEFLARLFCEIDPHIIETWIRKEPTGQYSRKTGFFYEWLTGQRLNVPDVIAGNYFDALDPDQYLTAPRSVNNQRWRVRDNLPGTREFCPMVRRTDAVHAIEDYSCSAALQSLEVQFGAELLLRSANWLSHKESRASFLIEHEEQHVDRVRRFAAVMGRRCGGEGDPLQEAVLTQLQEEILGKATRYGLRKSPVFVGHNDAFVPVGDYIAPQWEDARELLAGLSITMAKTRNQSAIVRAAVASFAFVYIHPMTDGNGRISRFLVNDVLRRDGAVPAPFILPISATITNNSRERVGYDRALEAFSKPLMARFSDRYDFNTEIECEDGVRTNFRFDAYEEAMPAWRYPELTQQVEYMGHVVRMTIEDEMTNEASYLRNLERAREAVKNRLEGPNTDIDSIIRSLKQNGWQLSGSLRKRFPQLEDSRLAELIIEDVRAVYEPLAKAHDDEDNARDVDDPRTMY